MEYYIPFRKSDINGSPSTPNNDKTVRDQLIDDDEMSGFEDELEENKGLAQIEEEHKKKVVQPISKVLIDIL